MQYKKVKRKQLNRYIVNTLLGNLGANYISFESVVRIIIIIDNGLRIVGSFLLQGDSRQPK